MDAATAEHVISQVGRVLDAEVTYRNRQMATVAQIRRALLPPNLMNPEPEKSPMSITGLKSGAFQDMLAEMRKEIAEAQNQGVADVASAKDQAKADIKNTISGVKDKIKSEVSDALQEFSEFTNGGPE